MLKVLVQGYPGPATRQPFSSALLPGSSSSIAASPLLTALPFLNNPSFSTHPPGTSLDPINYPNIKFWYRKDWLNFLKDGGNSTDVGIEPIRGKTLMSKGINKNAKYIEDADGKPVDGWRLRDIRSHACAIWESFRSVGRAPSTWRRANTEVSSVCRREMRTKFPELTFCENDWKADQLATEHYPSWYSNHIKAEIKEEEKTDSGPLAGSKRSSSTELAADRSKKTKKVGFAFPCICIA